MNKLFTLMALATVCSAANAQSTPEKETSADTIRIGNIIIAKSGNKTTENKEKSTTITLGRETKRKYSKVSTNWGIIDIGLANYSDKTNYANAGSYLYNVPGTTPLGKSDFKLRSGKSIDVNIWFFMQRLSLIKQYVNLKYGLGLELNNYRYNLGTNISYLQNDPFVTGQTNSAVVFRDSISFRKDKLAADYLTIPLMLNFATTPGYLNKGLSFSAGVSAGYLYSERNKQKSAERGKEKNKGDYDLERFKLSYIAEIGLGPIRFYGSYSPKSFYSRGLDMRPYTVGIRFSNW